MISSSPFSLKGRKILITGASSGIGRTIAIETTKVGAELIICGRNEDKLNETFSLINSLGSFNHKKISFDLSDEEKIAEVVSEIDKLDGIVFAAGVDQICPFILTTRAHIYKSFESNFIGHTLFLQKLLKQKLLNKSASTVFISSVNGTVLGSKGHSLYAATKGAVNGLVRSLANELSSKKMRVNAIAPGMVKAGLFEVNAAVLSEEELEQHQKDYPLGFGEAEDVAYLCIYLLSNASKWMTGQILTLDGGLTINR